MGWSDSLLLDTLWPSDARGWGQLWLEGETLIVLDTYHMVCVNRSSRAVLWKREKPAWTYSKSLLPWGTDLYLDEGKGSLIAIDRATGEERRVPLPGLEGTRFQLHLLKTGLLVQGPQGLLGLFDPTRQTFLDNSYDAEEAISSIRVSRCRSQFALTCRQHCSLVSERGQLLRRWQMPEWLGCVQAEPDIDRVLAFTGFELRLFDGQTNLLARCQGHGSPIQGLAVSPSGTAALTWDESGWVRRWPLA